MDEALKLLKRGNECRVTICTDWNQDSSRSHMVLNVQVTSRLENDLAIFGNVYLVGLVDSKRVCKSAIEI